MTNKEMMAELSAGLCGATKKGEGNGNRPERG